MKKKVVQEAPVLQNVASPAKKVVQSHVKGGEKRRRKPQSVAPVDTTPLDDGVQKKRARIDRPQSKPTVVGVKDSQTSRGHDEGRSRISPEVLFSKLQGVFDVFWDLELDPPAVATPFFGLITRNNCDMLGLPRFFDKVIDSCSLANINVRSCF